MCALRAMLARFIEPVNGGRGAIIPVYGDATCPLILGGNMARIFARCLCLMGWLADGLANRLKLALVPHRVCLRNGKQNF